MVPSWKAPPRKPWERGLFRHHGTHHFPFSKRETFRLSSFYFAWYSTVWGIRYSFLRLREVGRETRGKGKKKIGQFFSLAAEWVDLKLCTPYPWFVPSLLLWENCNTRGMLGNEGRTTHWEIYESYNNTRKCLGEREMLFQNLHNLHVSFQNSIWRHRKAFFAPSLFFCSFSTLL